MADTAIAADAGVLGDHMGELNSCVSCMSKSISSSVVKNEGTVGFAFCLGGYRGDVNSTSESSSDDSAGVSAGGFGTCLVEENSVECLVVGDVRNGSVRSFWSVLAILCLLHRAI